ncbi:cobalt transporter [Mycobacterium sp. MS1601]|uniref:CbtA family protein n=1 Tax=Mycobacterium sp. MS1601 TaxID=1936029 RepID=UPI0009798594|nr:CbtA family protein [Mycobacterium sp. MS1601]AQA02337.1 cobalt transporter [Mycobacterium sp. MS1601]
MEKHIIGRGVLAGVAGAVSAFVFARIFLEPVIERAIGYEEGVSAAHEASHGGHSHGEGVELFTRAVQANIGMGFGVLAFSAAMGALLAVVFCVTYGHIGDISARALSGVLAAGMLLSVWVVPALKYPPNPPAVSLDGTLQQRTLLYVLMVVLSVVILVAAVHLGRRLTTKLGAWNAALSAGGAYVGAVAVLMLVLPTIDETPGPIVDDAGVIVFGGFPADDLYEFRLYSFGTQLVMWVAIALVFGALVSRVVEGARRQVVPT